jgi:putative transposase
MIKTHKIRIYPNKEQKVLLFKAFGIGRFVYNWALARWNELYKQGKKPDIYSLKKEFNSIKRKEFPFVMEVTKNACECSFFNLQNAFSKFFKKTAKYPRFKKRKWGIGSFRLDNDRISIKNKRLTLSTIGEVRLSEELRFKGKIQNVTISTQGDCWFASITVDTVILVNKQRKIKKTIGIDLGLKTQLTCSDKTKIDLPDIKKQVRRVIKKQKELSKKTYQSKNYFKQLTKLQKSWLKYNWKKEDYQHKLTTLIANQFDIVCLEDLNIKGMLKNHSWANKLSHISLSKIVSLLESKTKVLKVDRFFPSTKLCHKCGYKNNSITLDIREWNCPSCGTNHDRDVNAAKNILRKAIADVKPVDKRPLRFPSLKVPASFLNETGIKLCTHLSTQI